MSAKSFRAEIFRLLSEAPSRRAEGETMTEDRAEQIVAALEAFINAKIRANEDPANYGDVAFFARQELFAILAAPKEQP